MQNDSCIACGVQFLSIPFKHFKHFKNVFFHFFYHFREAFKALDADGDGVVSKEDLKKKLLQALENTEKIGTENAMFSNK